MKCPECGSGSRIFETRELQSGMKRRRHQCPNGHRFTTHGSGVNLKGSNQFAPAKKPERETLTVRPVRQPQGVAKPAWFALQSALFMESRNEKDVG